MDRYAVFGNPIAHSKSPVIHATFARQTDQAMEYNKQEIPLDGFVAAVDNFFKSGGCGLNITVPFKLEACEYADSLTTRAQKAQAVNTLLMSDGKVIGDNTDGYGLVTDLTTVLEWPLADQRVLILGAGGAVRGILQPMIDAGVAEIVIANRTLAKAETLAEAFSGEVPISACEFGQLQTHFDLVINGTSASLSGDLPPLPSGVVSEKSACYDMMYGKEPTVFMRWAQSQGVECIADGLGMLVGQAAESFYCWRGVRPEVQPIIRQLRNEL